METTIYYNIPAYCMVVIIVTAATISGLSCPPGRQAFPAEGLCYWEPAGFTGTAIEGQARCQQEGGGLAVIPSQAAHDFVDSKFSAPTDGTKMALGYQFDASRQFVLWGMYPICGHSWNPPSSYPDLDGSASQQCAFLREYSSGAIYWTDGHCTVTGWKALCSSYDRDLGSACTVCNPDTQCGVNKTCASGICACVNGTQNDGTGACSSACASGFGDDGTGSCASQCALGYHGSVDNCIENQLRNVWVAEPGRKSSDVMLIMHARSAIECATKCRRRENCRSWNFKKATGQCDLCSKVKAAAVTSAAGFKHYELQ